MFRLHRVFMLSSLIFTASLALAQETATDPSEIFDMPLEDLMKVTITGHDRELSADEAPALITVISREQIKSSPSRNLIDIFKMVPSFQIGSDYGGTLALGVRGMWAIEGKIQFMIDGIELSELFYNSSLFWNSFPVDQISRIEIIRGPGSVLYGNTAEYAVINVITLSAEELNGAHTTVQYGRMEDGLERKSLSLGVGTHRSKDWDVTAKIFSSDSGNTDRTIIHADGSLFPGKDNTQNSQLFNISGSYKNLSARFLADMTKVGFRDTAMGALVEPTEYIFNSYAAQLQYKLRFGEMVTLTPTYSWRRSIPYKNDDSSLAIVGGGTAEIEVNFDSAITRHKILIPANFQLSDSLALLGGVEYYKDTGKSDSYGFYPTPSNPAYTTNELSFETHALFTEATWKTAMGTLSTGARYEGHNHFDGNFVPRASWVHQLNAWNFKALYSYAYRNPSIGNYSFANLTGVTVEPEKVRVAELEAGYKFTKNWGMRLNLFDILSQKTLVYTPVTFGYVNGDRTGSTGAELDLKYSSRRGYSQLGGTYYDASKNRVSRYAVTQDGSQLAGFANFKATWDNKYFITPSFSSQVTVVHTSDHYGFSGDINSDGNMETRAIKNSTIVSLFFNYENLGIKGLQLGVGAANLFDADEVYSTAYDLGREPLPGPSRELLAHLKYGISF